MQYKFVLMYFKAYETLTRRASHHLHSHSRCTATAIRPTQCWINFLLQLMSSIAYQNLADASQETQTQKDAGMQQFTYSRKISHRYWYVLYRYKSLINVNAVYATHQNSNLALLIVFPQKFSKVLTHNY